ncbi:MAG: hypothetical protein J6Q22_10445 [Prevotella sp.]|nr:hypothetical protein [Prevotella sp.]
MNFFSFCEDEQVKVKVEGTPVHRFFAPEGFMLWGLEPKAGNFKGYAQIVDMPIEEFLGLAEPIPEDDEKRHSPQEEFKKNVLDGKPTDWDIPYLVCKENEDGIWKVIGHDGRHRGILLKSLGFSSMPVLLQMPDAELNEELLPEILWGQNDKSVERDKDFYPFPINEDNFMKPYIGVGDGVVVVGDEENGMTIAMDETTYPAGCDSKNLKAYLGEVKAEDRHVTGDGDVWKAPDYCVSAKRNFAKNFVANPAYRPDNTMPARNLKEYLEKNN